MPTTILFLAETNLSPSIADQRARCEAEGDLIVEAGKTSFLEALHSAIGSGVRQFSEDDLWTDLNEKHAPKDRSIIVDILIRPIDKDGKFEDVFPEGSAWSELFGNGIQQDDDDHDFVAIRTTFGRDLPLLARLG